MKPILFNTEMVRAILECRKTVTRRVVRPQPYTVIQGNGSPWCGHFVSEDGKVLADKPPYCLGDILYVRETWAPLYPNETSNEVCGYIYKADPLSVECYDARFPNGEDYTWEGRWRSSVSMPREAARLFLRVTDVRVERLQEMTDDDFVCDFGFCQEAIQAVGRDALAIPFWDSTINPADRALYGWAANPWVWVIEFERCENPETEPSDGDASNG